VSEHTWEREGGGFTLEDYGPWSAIVEKAWAGHWNASLEREGEEIEHDFGAFKTAKQAREAVEAYIDSWKENGTTEILAFLCAMQKRLVARRAEHAADMDKLDGQYTVTLTSGERFEVEMIVAEQYSDALVIQSKVLGWHDSHGFKTPEFITIKIPDDLDKIASISVGTS